MVHPAYSDTYNTQKVSGETQSGIFFQIDLCRPGCRMGGPPAFRMITMVDIDVLEQRWLAQFGLAAAGGPHDDHDEVGERPVAGEACRAVMDR